MLLTDVDFTGNISEALRPDGTGASNHRHRQILSIMYGHLKAAIQQAWNQDYHQQSMGRLSSFNNLQVYIHPDQARLAEAVEAEYHQEFEILLTRLGFRTIPTSGVPPPPGPVAKRWILTLTAQ